MACLRLHYVPKPRPTRAEAASDVPRAFCTSTHERVGDCFPLGLRHAKILDGPGSCVAHCCRLQQTHRWSDRLMNPMPAKHRVTVNLDDREYRELSALAEKYRVSLAWLLRQGTVQFLDRHAQDEMQLPLGLSPERRADR